MTDNLKVKASKAADDVNVAAHAAYDDATVVVMAARYRNRIPCS